MGNDSFAFGFREEVADRRPESVPSERERERVSVHDVPVVAQQEDHSRGVARRPELDAKHVPFEWDLKLSNSNQRRRHGPEPSAAVKMIPIRRADDDARRTSR